ncbi:hypothetical protein V1264_012082 [Littorina saxatilis]|uniref:Kinetochore protein Nuf2 N-terminal domain-containing protein n=2 Tax=Littorina saxatilis TaxID=31220 RepID=A0AAN9BU69_9CAEN
MALQKKMSAAGIQDFTVRDLLEPKPKRLQRNVSGAINFIRFAVYRQGVFDTKKDELEKQRESYDFVLKENADLKKTLHAKREAHEMQMSKMKQLQEENDAISVRIQDLHKQREVHQRNLSEMKNELSQRNASSDQVKVNILTAQAEGEKLSLRIVQSPERVKAEQERAKNRIMSLKATEEEKQRRLGELQRKKESVGSQERDAEKAVKLLRDISNDSDRLTELEKAVRKQQDIHQDLRSSSLGIMSKRDNLRQVQASRQDKLSKLDLQYHNKKASLQEQISQLKHSKETVHDPKGSNESKKSEVMAEIENVKGEVHMKEEELEAKVERTNNLYSEIITQVDKMNVEVAEGFSEFRKIMKTN